AGLGFEPLDEASLADVEREFERRGIPVHVELASLASPEIGALLTRRGYTLTGFENVLALPPSTAPPHALGPVTVTRTSPAQCRQWVDVITTGFANPDTFDGPPSTEQYPRELLEPIFGDLTTLENFAWYLASRNGQVAGAASMRMANGIAQLCGA